MEQLKILLWAAMHSPKFREICIHFPIQFETPYRYSQSMRISMIVLYAWDCIIFIPWTLQRDYHNHVIKQGLGLDLSALEYEDDGIPF